MPVQSVQTVQTAPDFKTLICLRFVQALGAGGASALTILLISDRFDLGSTAQLVSLTMVIAMLSRVVALLAGFQIGEVFGWQSVFLCLAAISGVVLMYFSSGKEYHEHSDRHRTFAFSTVLTDSRLILADSRTRFYIGAEVATSIGLFAYVGSASLVIINHLEVPAAQFSRIYAAGTALMMVGAYINSRLVTRIGVDHTMLWACLPMGVVSLTLLGMATLRTGGSPVVIALVLAFLLPMIIVRVNANAGCVKRFPEAAVTASSLLNAIGLITGALSAAICCREPR